MHQESLHLFMMKSFNPKSITRGIEHEQDFCKYSHRCLSRFYGFETLVNNDTDIDALKDNMRELDEALRCLKHEMKQLKERPVVSSIQPNEPVDLSPLENDLRCLKYEVKRLKERPVCGEPRPSRR